jgi:N-acetyl-anhydromuramyl-L-alanine amidase AmpD
MKILTDLRSPNIDPTQRVDVQFFMVHYTATSLERTLELFQSPSPGVSAHLVVAEDGTIFEMVPCLDHPPVKAFHAGKSTLDTTSNGQPRRYEGFNDCSIGVEVVNPNGNVRPYTDLQYRALTDLIGVLRTKYPPLDEPTRIIGHEDVAGWRGKIDPGWEFNWERLLRAAYPSREHRPRSHALPPICLAPLRHLFDLLPPEPSAWESLSYLLERAVGWYRSPTLRSSYRAVPVPGDGYDGLVIAEDVLPALLPLLAKLPATPDARRELAALLLPLSREAVQGSTP